MIEGYDIVCFSGDWDGDPLSKRHIMLRLARRNRVLWVNSIGNRTPTASARDVRRAFKKIGDLMKGVRRVHENLFVFSPLAIPFHGNRVARAINKRLLTAHLRFICQKLAFKNIITWSFIPSSAEVVGSLGERLVLYHCVDEFSEFVGADKHAIQSLERTLIAKSDAVVVSSAPLLESKRRHHANTFLVTHGVEVEHFRRACDPRTIVPADVAALPRPVIGFYGLIAEWVDLALVRDLACARPHWSFVLIGKADTDTSILRGLANVHLLGRREYADLPAYCRGWDVAMLPFVVNTLTLAANPLKLREYLAAGLPVVASDIPEIRRVGGAAHVCSDAPAYLTTIEKLIAERRTGPQLSISHSMDRESWDEKVAELSRVVEKLERARRPWQPLPSLAEPTAS